MPKKKLKEESSFYSDQDEEIRISHSPIQTPDPSDLSKDFSNIILLIVLYLLQGIPLGLAMGSMPFLLKKKFSYAEMATFSLTAYPYSLKLLWSPVVDALYIPSIGRRKTWIIPIQFILGILFLQLSPYFQSDETFSNIDQLSLIFLFIVFLSATQDIAVDGWALTLLSKENLGFASTCQTIGLNTGYFISFTVFLALHSADFCNQYLRSKPESFGIIELSSFLYFWGFAYFAVTFWLLLFTKEKEELEEVSIKSAYLDIWKILNLDNMKIFMLILLTAKIGFVTNDSVTAFKLLEKGFQEEELGLAALINFPLQILFGYYAAKWSRPPNRLQPWSYAFIGRLLTSLLAMAVVYSFPSTGVNSIYFSVVIISSVLSNFMSTVQFASMGAFYAIVADPYIGGTYMTLLNTLSNFGGTYPQYFILKAVDALTIANCKPSKESSQQFNAFSCSSKLMKQSCLEKKGICEIEQDGYYIVNTGCFIIASILFIFFIRPQIMHLQTLQPQLWHLKKKIKD